MNTSKELFRLITSPIWRKNETLVEEKQKVPHHITETGPVHQPFWTVVHHSSQEQKACYTVSLFPCDFEMKEVSHMPSGTEVGSTMLTPHSRKPSSHPKTCYYVALPKRKYSEDGAVVKDIEVVWITWRNPGKLLV